MNKQITVNAEAFIIPNSASKVARIWEDDSEYAIKYQQPKYQKVYDDNDLTRRDNDKLVQLWYTSEELHSENLCNHGFSIDIEGTRYYVENHDVQIAMIPSQLLKGVNENETFDVTIKNLPVYGDRCDYEPTMRIDLTLHCTAKQLEYRYKRFGAFQDVLNQVC